MTRTRLALALALSVALVWTHTPARAAITFGTGCGFPVSAVSADTITATTAAIDTTACAVSLLVGACNWYIGVTTAVALTDSASNTWTPLTRRTSGGANSVRLFYVNSATPSTSASHTFTCRDGVNVSYPGALVWGLIGTAASPFDQEGGAASAGTVTSLTHGGTVTPTEDCEAVVSAVGHEGAAGSTPAITESYSPVQYSAYVTGVAEGVAGAYKIQTTATGTDPTWSWVTAKEAVTGLATFKSAVCGSGAVASRLPLTGVGK